MLRVAVVDDEFLFREQLAGMVERYGRESGIEIEVTTYDDGSELLEAGASEDIFLLDIEMEDVDGMKTARRLRSAGVTAPIIFVTNLAQYAVKGYEVSALDFIVKPVKYAPFAFKFRRAVEAAGTSRVRSVLLQAGADLIRVQTRDILYVEVHGHKLVYHTARGPIELWGTMKGATEQLAGAGFELCNVCYLVNLEKVTRLAGESVWVGEDELKMSRSKRKSFVDALTRQGR